MVRSRKRRPALSQLKTGGKMHTISTKYALADREVLHHPTDCGLNDDSYDRHRGRCVLLRVRRRCLGEAAIMSIAYSIKCKCQRLSLNSKDK